MNSRAIDPVVPGPDVLHALHARFLSEVLPHV
jgi:hypothetical protein